MPQVQKSPVAFTMWYLRCAEPNLKGVARETTGGIVGTEWGRSPAIRAALDGVKARRHEKWCTGVIDAAWRHMEESRDAVLARCEARMKSPEWGTWTEDERGAYLVAVAAASAEGRIGGPTALLSCRILETTLFRVFGTKRCYKTLANVMDRLEKRGCFKIKRGKRGHATKDNANRYRMLDEDHYTSHQAIQACVSKPSRQWLAEMAPLFTRIREALEESIEFFRRLKVCPEYKNRHIPWEMCYYRPAEFDQESVWQYMDEQDLAIWPPPRAEVA